MPRRPKKRRVKVVSGGVEKDGDTQGETFENQKMVENAKLIKCKSGGWKERNG